MPSTAPFFSIISVARNDAWPLSKSMRSLFQQHCKDFEFIVVDGASTDGTLSLVDFWRATGLVDQFVSEQDSGVYDAMNKGLRRARGQFVCFLNAGDVFATPDVLEDVKALLQAQPLDGVLGWGELNGQLWASWVESPAFKLASLGFCHQSLFARRECLLRQPFDDRPGRTDSDTLQMGRMLEQGARIAVLPKVLAVRGGEPGISANLERTRVSILQTMVEEYPELAQEEADLILSLRRRGEGLPGVLALLARAAEPLRSHLALLLLDTLLLRQSRSLSAADVGAAYDEAMKVLEEAQGSAEAALTLRRLIHAQSAKRDWLSQTAQSQQVLLKEVGVFAQQEAERLARLPAQPGKPVLAGREFVVSLTSFPARVPTLQHVIRSILNQSCRPREIFLWFGEDELPSRKWLPKGLLELEEHGLRIRFVPKTRYQYNKFLHNAQANRDLPLVIVDDDVIYPERSMEALLEQHARFPDAIVGNRCHEIAISDAGEVRPYREWRREVRFDRPGHICFPTGVGGVLYPPGFLSDERVTALDDILMTAPYADDVWLKACALAKGVRSVSTQLSKGSDWFVRYTPTMRLGALQATNVDLGMNDLQFQRCEQWLSTVRPAWREELLADGQ